MRSLALLLLLLITSCQSNFLTRRDRRQGRQGFQYGLPPSIQPSINTGYLPPTTGPTQCVQSTLYVTQTQYSTSYVVSTQYNNQGQVLTRTEYSTQIVPTVVYSNILSTQYVNSPVIQTQYVTVTRTNFNTQYVTQPGGLEYVTSTQFVDTPQVTYQTRYVTSVVQVPTTGVTTVLSTMVIPQQVISTVFNTQYITRTMQLPGFTQTVVSTFTSTILSTFSLPGSVVYLTSTVYSTNYITQTVPIPGATRTVVSSAVLPVYQTSISTIFAGNTQTQFYTSTFFSTGVSTVVSESQVVNYVTRTVTIPQVSTSVFYTGNIVTSTGYTQVVIPTVVTVNGGGQVVTITQTVLSTVVIPGGAQTSYFTSVVYSTNYITSTYYNTNVQTTVITITATPSCGGSGYNYNTPGVPFNAFG